MTFRRGSTYDGIPDEVRLWGTPSHGSLGATSAVYELLTPTTCPTGTVMAGAAGTECCIGSQTAGVTGRCNNNWVRTDQHNNGVGNYTYRCCPGWLAAIFQ